MKIKSKTLLLIIAVLASLTSCTLMPGSDQWKIKLAATTYVEHELKTGEKMQWGHIERKRVCNVNGRDCKYAEIKYSIILTSGKVMYKTLYLLMSDSCDSVYNISEHINTQYAFGRDIDLKKVKKLVNKRINQELKDRLP